MRKVIPIPIFNLTFITPRTVQSHLYDHGLYTQPWEVTLNFTTGLIMWPSTTYPKKWGTYSISCCAKKWLFIVSSTGGIFLHALPKIKIHWVLAVCNWSAKPPILKSVGEVICTIYPYGYPHSHCPPDWPTVFTISITGFFHWKTRFKSYEKFNDDKGKAEMNLFV